MSGEFIIWLLVLELSALINNYTYNNTDSNLSTYIYQMESGPKLGILDHF